MEVESRAILERSSVLMEVSLGNFFLESPSTSVPLSAFSRKRMDFFCPGSFYPDWKPMTRFQWNPDSPVVVRKRRRRPSTFDFITP